METVTNLTKRFQALRGRVENTSDELEYLPLHDTAPLKRRNPLRSIAAIVLITILCLLSFWAGYVVKGQYEQPTMIAGTAPRVFISSLSRQLVKHNYDFEAPPPDSNGTEPIWDSLIPDGLGYIRHPTLAPDLSIISVFHELHCLYLLRRAYYSTTNGGEVFDFGIDRGEHVAHCFDYIRQGIICSADSTLEPAVEKVNSNPDWGFQRQCRSFDEVKNWAETWRLFNAQGFIATLPNGHDNSHRP